MPSKSGARQIWVLAGEVDLVVIAGAAVHARTLIFIHPLPVKAGLTANPEAQIVNRVLPECQDNGTRIAFEKISPLGRAAGKFPT